MIINIAQTFLIECVTMCVLIHLFFAMRKNMLKRIVLSVVVLAICVPLYGVKVTFKRDGQTAREYTIIKSWTQIIQRVPYETAISRQKTYKVNDETLS